MSRDSLKWPIAKGMDGQYVRIQDARRGAIYKCPQCSAPFIAQLGSAKEWHFAHYPGAVCTGEGTRHDLTKHMIALAISTIKELPLYCGCLHLPTKPFPSEFTDAQVDNVIGEYRVDITCKWMGFQLFIDVVDTNVVPGDKRYALGKRLVEVSISKLTDEDVLRGERMLEALKTELSAALSRLVQSHAFIHTWTRKCSGCKRPLRVAAVCGQSWAVSLPQEIVAALRRCATIEYRRKANVREGVFVNACPDCHTVQWDLQPRREMMEILRLRPEDGIDTVYVPLAWEKPESI